MAIILTLVIIFLFLSINEIWWHLQKKHNEFSRKFIHVIIGVYTAFWPFYLSFTDIKLLALAGLFVLSFSKYFNIMRAIHGVDRSTWGEELSAVSVGTVAILTHNKWLFAASLLQMALADGLAAVVGVKYGKNNSYKILGYVKSLVGSMTFFVSSLAILIVFKETGHIHTSLIHLGLISIVATGLENLGVQGLDNLIVPVVVLIMLR